MMKRRAINTCCVAIVKAVLTTNSTVTNSRLEDGSKIDLGFLAKYMHSWYEQESIFEVSCPKFKACPFQSIWSLYIFSQ